MEPNKQKRKIRLPFSAVLLYLALIAILLSGVTFSRYMAGTTVVDTARVASMKNITITETGNFTEQNKWVILPGVNLNKNAVIHFDGSERENMPMLVRSTVRKLFPGLLIRPGRFSLGMTAGQCITVL